jgi:Tfp pilus assembly protein FimT
LVEIMVVVAIMGVVMTMAIPSMWRKLHPESMQKAVSDMMEACSHARANAILGGVITELVVRPYARQISVQATGSATADDSPFGGDDAAPRPKSGGGGEAFSFRVAENIMIEGIRLNLEDWTEDEEVRVRFYPNGTADEFSIFFVSDKAERRQIFLEVTTGLADLESDPLKFR